jgi:antitoxin (DNA-binding transcriptional repressor) of toxin-antitoxin stability system
MGVRAVDLKDVPPALRHLVDDAVRDGELIITDEGEAVAKIVPLRRRAHATRRPGSARGAIVHMADDFDGTSEDFRPQIL